VGSQLTRVLIDSGSGLNLNLLFASTLKKMGLNIAKILTSSKAPFYGIIPVNAARPLGSVVLPVTKDNYHTVYIKFELAVPHYVYLLLKMLGKTGVLTFHGDQKKWYDCDQEVIEYAATSCVPEPSVEVFVATQKLANSEMEISNKKPSHSREEA
jgi:hypothetical protein